MSPTLLLCLFSLLAGFIDSIVGGGGLISIPALLLILPTTPVPTLLGTNKFSAVAGTGFAAWRYSRAVTLDWKMVGPASFAAFVFSFLGSLTVTHLAPTFLRPIILALLVLVAIYVFVVKDLGLVHKPKHAQRKAISLGVLTGIALGFYDGFFGPGTGSFLIFIFVGIFGFDFLAASASSKMINCATNLASVIYFTASGHVLYEIAVPMAACNIAGSFLGTRLAILKGSKFVRVIFLAVVIALIARLGYQLFEPTAR